jgi:hypothetical protein
MEGNMEAETFRTLLLNDLQDNINNLQEKDKEWVIKGFIDIDLFSIKQTVQS